MMVQESKLCVSCDDHEFDRSTKIVEGWRGEVAERKKGHKLKVKRVLQNFCWLFMSPIMKSQSYWQLPPKLLPQMIGGDQIGLFGSLSSALHPVKNVKPEKSLLPNS